MFIEKLPFIDKIQETWATNFYPSWVFYILKHSYAIYFAVVSNFILNIENYSRYHKYLDKEHIPNEKVLRNLQNHT